MANYYIINGELYHHGILGMKWGVRRYQNSDGTLTAAGKKRYQVHRGDSKLTKWIKKRRKESDRAKIEKLDKKAAEKEAKKAAEQELKDYKKLSKKKPSKMTDEELTRHIHRLVTEKQMISLRSELEKLAELNEGKKFAEKEAAKQQKKDSGFRKHFAENAIKPALTTAGKDLLTNYLKKQGGKLMGLDDNQVDSSMKLLKDMAEKAGYKKTIANAEVAELQLKDKKASTAQKEAEAKTAKANQRRAEAEAKAAEEAAKRLAKSKSTTTISTPSFKSNAFVGEDFVQQYTWDDYYDDWV